MAADLYLTSESQRTKEIILRLYAWEKPTLSLGYHQKLTPENIDRCKLFGVPIVRRPTGGRAVLHDREVTYAITIPNGHPVLKQGREAVLRDIGGAFTTAAHHLGLKAELVRFGNRTSSKPGSPLCFDSISRWGGAAQRTEMDRFRAAVSTGSLSTARLYPDQQEQH